MSRLRISSGAQQVAAHLRAELLRGRWSGTMPGRGRLAAELGVSGKLVEAGLEQLEREGLLVSQGPRRRRRVVLPADLEPASLRVAILDFDRPFEREGYKLELLHLLLVAGHAAFFTKEALVDLRMDVRRVARLVERTEADAWVVVAGSREVLGWFVEQPRPSFAFFGRRLSLPIAGVGPDKVPVMRVVARRLFELGHRRIVLLARTARRLPRPGPSERAFLEELEALDVPPGAYNLPDWEESIEGLHERLDSMFRYTPPTALIVDESPLFLAVQQHLARRGILAPERVSLVCTDADPNFAWMRPSVAHIRWDSRPVVRRVVRWANNVSRGRDDRRQTLTKAEFVEGGTIGPPPKA